MMCQCLPGTPVQGALIGTEVVISLIISLAGIFSFQRITGSNRGWANYRTMRIEFLTSLLTVLFYNGLGLTKKRRESHIFFIDRKTRQMINKNANKPSLCISRGVLIIAVTRVHPITVPLAQGVAQCE